VSTALAARQPAQPSGRPGYWRLFGVAAFAQFFGAIALLGIGILLSLTSLVGLNSGAGLVTYAPWVVDGPWAALGDIGWGLLVVALVAVLIRERIQTLLGLKVSRVLTLAAVALAGYLPWVVASTATGRVLISLLVMPAAVSGVVFDATGEPRRLRPVWELSGIRHAALLGASALALVTPFALLHPLSVHGNGEDGGGTYEQSAGGFVYTVRPGHLVAASVGLQGGLFPIRITRIEIVPSSSALRVVRITRGSTPPFMRPVRRWALHFAVSARGSFWIGFAVELTRCVSQPVAVGAIRISYTQLGLPLSQTVSLSGNDTLLACA
jgi:hypothetical protein